MVSGRGVGVVSTLGFNARPAASALDATGYSAPMAAANTTEEGPWAANRRCEQALRTGVAPSLSKFVNPLFEEG